ncbi:MAG TPA: hypothetical protein VKZ61_08005 [Thermomicrobiales bacterium]|jgi:hypothetical protein|nr:hypothetical protein [Thermomicrobiales bacterium]
MGHEPDYVPPPPSGNASPKQVGLIFGLALVLVVFVLVAFYQSPDAIMQVGAFLIFLGLVFGAGLVSRNETVQLITAGIMMLGVGGAVSLGINSGDAFWYVGAVLFVLCAAIIVGKDRFLTES